MAKISEIFGRINEFGTVDILYIEDAEPATCIEDAPSTINNIKPAWHAGQTIESVKYNSSKITITISDARLLGIEIEGA
ncbi:hypothetical protein [Raoultella terrigena]|jgi:hypothetical protein|uniref:hypothetical protein n=1 Tax=Raoultella terrigena TaxID=577 RepID=UPI00349F8A3A